MESIRLVSAAGIWGDVPDWVSSIATVFALLFAATAAVATRRTYRIESERDQINTEARRAQDSYVRQAQAALVSAWWGESPETKGEWGTYIRNASGAPIYQVYGTVLEGDDSSDGSKIHHPVVPPSLAAQFCPVAVIGNRRVSDRDVAHRVKISFTDASGVRWLRNQYGRLAEVRSTLRVKTDPDRARVLTRFEEHFLATYGVTVAFETDPEHYPQSRFMADVGVPDVADALVGPHDWIGALVVNRVIEPTILSAGQRSVFPEWALDGLTHEGRLYGVPITVDTVALIRNTRLVPDLPATFDELLRIGQALRDAGRVTEALAVRIGERGDPFQIWPLFTSAGGQLFGRTPDGRWDLGQVGLASRGSIAAFERLRELGESGKGILRRSMDGAAACECFAAGRSPFLITTSDGLQAARVAGIPLAVSAVPPFAGGSTGRAFTLIHGLFITRLGANKATAHDLFADYLSHNHVMSALSTDIGSPVALADAEMGPGVRQYQELCAVGDLMPSSPAMQEVWEIVGRAEAAAVAGQRAALVAHRAADDVTAAVDRLRQRH